MKASDILEKNTIQRLIFFAVFIVLFVLVMRLFMPFLTVLLWAAILFGFLDPVYVRLAGIKNAGIGKKRFASLRRALSAGLVSISAVFIIVVPLSMLVFLLIKQSSDAIGDILEFLKSNPYVFKGRLSHVLVETGLASAAQEPQGPIAAVANLAPLARLGDFLYSLSGGAIDLGSLDLQKVVMEFLKLNQAAIVNISTKVVQNLGGFVLALAFMTFTLYFFFMDGHYLLEIFIKAVPIRSEYMDKFIRHFKETTRQLIRGNMLVALIQGCIAFTLFLIFGVNGALLLGVLVSICSFIPIVGASAIWMPVGISYVFMNSVPAGILLLALSGAGISLLDNFYRPILVGGPIKMHPLPIFFAIIGGVASFGINGLIIGPLILVLFFAALDIFREIYDFKESHPAEEPPAKPAN